MVRMILESFKLVNASLLFKHECKLVFPIGRVVLLPNFQHVVDAFQSNGKHSCLLQTQNLSKALQDAFLDQVVELYRGGTSCTVADCPHCFLPDLKFIIDQQVQELVDDPNVYARLDLLLTPSSYVRQGPAYFLPHSLLLVVDYSVQGVKGTIVQSILGLLFISSDYVSYGSEAWD